MDRGFVQTLMGLTKTTCSSVMNSTYSSSILISGTHSVDIGRVMSSIPQKSEEFQVRNSFVQKKIKIKINARCKMFMSAWKYGES